MDLDDAGVRSELLREDEQALTRHRYRMIWVAVPFGVVAALVLLVFGFGLLAYLGAAAIAYVASLVLGRVFPPRQRFPYLRDPV